MIEKQSCKIWKILFLSLCESVRTLTEGMCFCKETNCDVVFTRCLTQPTYPKGCSHILLPEHWSPDYTSISTIHTSTAVNVIMSLVQGPWNLVADGLVCHSIHWEEIKGYQLEVTWIVQSNVALNMEIFCRPLSSHLFNVLDSGDQKMQDKFTFLYCSSTATALMMDTTVWNL